MVTIKIECDCGQRYAFDVEPVNGQMSCPVACPACGADGTPTANTILTHALPPPPPSPPTPAIVVAPPPVKASGGLKVAASEHGTATAAPKITASATQLGLVEPEQAIHEARAKISWGNTKESVVQYLMVQKFSQTEAMDLVKGFYRERVADVRVRGFKQVIVGVSLFIVPVIVFVAYLHFKVMPMSLIAVGAAAGLWGFIKILNGTILMVVPKIEHGDVADQ